MKEDIENCRNKILHHILNFKNCDTFKIKGSGVINFEVFIQSVFQFFYVSSKYMHVTIKYIFIF